MSQIVDYDDINIMEQEYEGILNNLNIEQMPKDEALLKIIKQILDTITFFRIQEGDKKFIEKKYQQKMKNAIWSAVPNIGMVVAGGEPITMAISLACQVGMGYMNYRKAKADISLEKEMEEWQLERTAIEQFNGLRRELFDTAWRLSAAYNFPDQFRLTERQIKQYNEILMDTDLIRRYQRMDTIKDAFVAYPPFWYYFGNTANEIASSSLQLRDTTRQEFKDKAKSHFMQYRNSNQYGLLREDPVSAACALELVDLLDIRKDAAFIHQLLQEAIRYSGRANDVLQLASVTYLRLNDHEHAAELLSQLVNEQYNTILNAQLLSSIYAADYRQTESNRILARYEILGNQVGGYYLYPLPLNKTDDTGKLEEQFLTVQKHVLHEKYKIAMQAFAGKYVTRFKDLVPDPERNGPVILEHIQNVGIPQDRKYQMRKIFSNRRKAEAYQELLKECGYISCLFDLLNELFESCCSLDFMTEQVRNQLEADIREGILKNKAQLNTLQQRLDSGAFNILDMDKLLDMDLRDYTFKFFEDLDREINAYVITRSEMQDFALAEQNLSEFCAKEDLQDPAVSFGKDGPLVEPVKQAEIKRFDPMMLDDSAPQKINEAPNAKKMSDLIKEAIRQSIINSWRESYLEIRPP